MNKFTKCFRGYFLKDTFNASKSSEGFIVEDLAKLCASPKSNKLDKWYKNIIKYFCFFLLFFVPLVLNAQNSYHSVNHRSYEQTVNKAKINNEKGTKYKTKNFALKITFPKKHRPKKHARKQFKKNYSIKL